MPSPEASPKRPPPIAIIVSRYNQTITYRLRDGAVRAYVQAGGRESDLAIIESPGSFEIPMLVDEAARVELIGGVVALGCIVRGETDHDRYLADAVTKALLDISLDAGVPVGLGVLTVNTVEQAVQRSGGADGLATGNKGYEAMMAVLGTLGGIDALAGAGESGKVSGVRFTLPSGASDKASPDALAARAATGSAGKSAGKTPGKSGAKAGAKAGVSRSSSGAKR